MTRVAVNGFGRVGRLFLRAQLERCSPAEVVAINDDHDRAMLAYLLEFDTVHGHLRTPVVEVSEDRLTLDGRSIALFCERDPGRLPWADHDIDVVIEATGSFTMAADARRHLDAGAGRVIISAPATGADLTVCVGVNDHRYDPDRHTVLSNASCTTNCLAPLADVLHRAFGIASGFMTTVHAYTNDQNLLDLPHRGHNRDLRRARAAGQNIVPSTTGAAVAIGQVLPELEGRLDGKAVRVPVADGSLTDLVCRLDQPAGADAINEAFRAAAGSERLHGILEYTEAPLVSSDIVSNAHSCVFSACDTMSHRDHIKVLGWYDNEWAYANRLVDLAELVGGHRPATAAGPLGPRPHLSAGPLSSAGGG